MGFFFFFKCFVGFGADALTYDYTANIEVSFLQLIIVLYCKLINEYRTLGYMYYMKSIKNRKFFFIHNLSVWQILINLNMVEELS